MRLFTLYPQKGIKQTPTMNRSEEREFVGVLLLWKK